MKKIKALFVVAVILFGICAPSLQVKAQECRSFQIWCSISNPQPDAWGEICGGSYHDQIDFLFDLCDLIC